MLTRLQYTCQTAKLPCKQGHLRRQVQQVPASLQHGFKLMLVDAMPWVVISSRCHRDTGQRECMVHQRAQASIPLMYQKPVSRAALTRSSEISAMGRLTSIVRILRPIALLSLARVKMFDPKNTGPQMTQLLADVRSCDPVDTLDIIIFSPPSLAVRYWCVLRTHVLPAWHSPPFHDVPEVRDTGQPHRDLSGAWTNLRPLAPCHSTPGGQVATPCLASSPGEG